MAVNSKANKTGGHRSSGLKATSYSKTAPAVLVPPPAKAPTGLGPAGIKALMLRARKELTPISDPTQYIAD